jgi:hypothetical protein
MKDKHERKSVLLFYGSTVLLFYAKANILQMRVKHGRKTMLPQRICSAHDRYAWKESCTSATHMLCT